MKWLLILIGHGAITGYPIGIYDLRHDCEDKVIELSPHHNNGQTIACIQVTDIVVNVEGKTYKILDVMEEQL